MKQIYSKQDFLYPLNFWAKCWFMMLYVGVVFSSIITLVVAAYLYGKVFDETQYSNIANVVGVIAGLSFLVSTRFFLRFPEEYFTPYIWNPIKVRITATIVVVILVYPILIVTLFQSL